MATVTEVISVSIAAAVPTFTVLGAVIRNRFLIKDKKIEALQIQVNEKLAIIDAKDDIIQDLKIQKNNLEVTGALINRFFSQLPSAEEARREIK